MDLLDHVCAVVRDCQNRIDVHCRWGDLSEDDKDLWRNDIQDSSYWIGLKFAVEAREDHAEALIEDSVVEAFKLPTTAQAMAMMHKIHTQALGSQRCETIQAANDSGGDDG